MITARPGLARSPGSGQTFAAWYIVILALLLDWVHGQAIQDSRCYLMNGGAVENFFTSEDTAVGSVIGVLSVHGDPNETSGNIVLTLTEKNSPVMIAPGTKNITLIKALDKEAVSGPSSVYVNVRCDRKRTSDPSFIIPVSVRVTDANDNAPQWLGAPYRVRLSELTAVGTRVLQGVKATDADQHGPHSTIQYMVLPGADSEYFKFQNELDGTLVLNKPLDYETLSNFTLVLRAQDQGTPPLFSDTTLQVEVLDADDQNPKFLDDHYTAVLPDIVLKGMELKVSPQQITAIDQDVGISAPIFYSLTGDYKEYFLIDKDTGQMFIASDKNYNDIDMPLTLVIKATQYDNADRYALATLTINRRSVSKQPVQFIQKSYSASVLENLPVGSVIMTLVTNQPREKGLQYYVSDRSFLTKFAINSVGEVVLRKSLDYETEDSFMYHVMVTDGTANDTASMNITVLNVNDWDPRFRYPQYEFFLSPDTVDGSEKMMVGKVEVADGDKGDYIKLSLQGADANLFYITEDGEIYLKEESVPLLNSSVVHMVGVAVDSGLPPRQTSVPIIVHISEALMAAAGISSASSGNSTVIIIVFAAILGILAVVILLLLGYIYRAKQSKSSARSNKVASGYIQHEKMPPTTTTAGVSTSNPPNGTSTNPRSGNLAGNLASVTNALGAASGSLLSVSAGASTILANSNSSLNLNGALGQEGVLNRASQRYPFKTAPKNLAPPPPLAVQEVSGPTDVSLMSNHMQTGGDGNRSGVAWPSGTIPARVKKLSWDDDEQKNGVSSAEIHDATNPNVTEHMNLTVYF